MIHGFIICRPIFSEDSKRVVLAEKRAVSELAVPDILRREVRRTRSLPSCIENKKWLLKIFLQIQKTFWCSLA